MLRRWLEQPWGRAAAILCAVAVLTAVAAWHAFQQGRKRAGPGGLARALTQAAVFAALFGALLAVRRHVPVPMLMLERLVPSVGGLQAFLVAWYAAAMAGVLLDPVRTRKARQWAWRLFCGVFFAQFVLGAAGLTTFLTSGRLHAPLPAFIIYGPFYREAPSMMLVVAGISCCCWAAPGAATCAISARWTLWPRRAGPYVPCRASGAGCGYGDGRWCWPWARCWRLSWAAWAWMLPMP